MSQANKWSSTAGPIQTKKVTQALGKIRWEAASYTELSGVKGVDEHRNSFTVICGGGREDCTKASNDIGEKFAWTVTRENYQDIIAAVDTAMAELIKNRPVKDNRRTPEQEAESNARHQEVESARKAEEQERLVKRDALLPEVRAKYPWAESSERLSKHARCAENIRRELARTFSGVRFTVRSDYNRVSVHWDLGPATKVVDELLAKYKQGSWVHDGGDGYRQHDHSPEGEAIDLVLGRVEYINTSRSIDTQVCEQIARFICGHKGITFESLGQHLSGDGDTLADHAWRIAHSASIPAGARITGLDNHEDDMDIDTWSLVLNAPAAGELPASSSADGVTVTYNARQDGVEIHFPSKPDASVISRCKVYGFRWSMRSKCWYKRFNREAWSAAHRIAGIHEPAAPVSEDPAGAYVQAQEDAGQDAIAASIGA